MPRPPRLFLGVMRQTEPMQATPGPGERGGGIPLARTRRGPCSSVERGVRAATAPGRGPRPPRRGVPVAILSPLCKPAWAGLPFGLDGWRSARFVTPGAWHLSTGVLAHFPAATARIALSRGRWSPLVPTPNQHSPLPARPTLRPRSLFHVKQWFVSQPTKSCFASGRRPSTSWRHARSMTFGSAISPTPPSSCSLAPSARSWVDLGSGGGFPGLVLAILLAERAAAASDTPTERGQDGPAQAWLPGPDGRSPTGGWVGPRPACAAGPSGPHRKRYAQECVPERGRPADRYRCGYPVDKNRIRCDSK